MKIISLGVAMLSIALVARGEYLPSWWNNSSGPVIGSAAKNNFAIANAGQLKWMALQAKNHLDAALADQGGAGAAVTSLVASFKPQTGVSYTPAELDQIKKENYSAVNLGQLKAVAKPFYDRLGAVGYNTNLNLKANGYSYMWASDYPWDATTPVSANYAGANLGQLKLAFSFDVADSDANGTLDYQEGLYPAYDPARDTDGDGTPDVSDPQPNAAPTPVPAVANYYVNPTASSGGSGTSTTSPFQTIDQARVYLRTVDKSAVAGNIYVNLMPGDYFLKSPITFDANDSGYGANNIVYRSVDSNGNYSVGAAKIHAGAKLNGWSQVTNVYGQNVWRAFPDNSVVSPNLAGINLAALAAATRTIVDTTNVSAETFAWLARQPNQTGANPHPNPNPSNLTTVFAQIDHSAYAQSSSGGTASASPQTTPPTNLQLTYQNAFNPIASSSELSQSPLGSVVWWGPQNISGNLSDWSTKEDLVTAIDSSAKKFFLHSVSNLGEMTGDGAYRNVPGINERFYLQGFQSLLDANGEFFLAKDGSFVDYKPVFGGAGAPSVRLPVSPQLILVNGASNLMFYGLEFAFTQCASATTPVGAVTIQAGNYVTFNQCHFHHLGSLAVQIQPGCSHHSVLNSWIHDCGMGGAVLAGSPAAANTFNVVNTCVIENVGCLLTNATTTGGVVLDGTSSCAVYSTRISGSSRYGISLRGNVEIENGQLVVKSNQSPSDKNTINDVKLDHCASDSGDAAALHMVGINKASTGGPKNTFSRIYIRFTFNNGIPDIGPWGIYVDRHGGGTRHQIFRNVKSTDADNPLGGYHHNANPDQEFHNVSWEPGFDSSKVDWGNVASASNGIPSMFVGTSGPLQ